MTGLLLDRTTCRGRARHRRASSRRAMLLGLIKHPFQRILAGDRACELRNSSTAGHTLGSCPRERGKSRYQKALVHCLLPSID